MKKNRFIYFLIFTVCFSLTHFTMAQEEKKQLPYGGVLYRDTIPDLSFQPDSTLLKAKKKKKKQKKNIFYGIKARKGYTKEGQDQKQTVELFYVLKKYVEPTSYVDELYVWDMTKGKVVKVRKEDLTKLTRYKILHGPYTKYVGGKMVETGIFYVGTKHGRWEKYKWAPKWWLQVAGGPKIDWSKNENNMPILIGKTKYYKGFQKEAKITYYDFDRKKVREVMPYEYGENTGDYYYFLENGQVLTKGHYEDGKKVGMWIDYFSDKYKKQRETQYPATQWEIKEPVIMKEWDAKGNLIISNGEKVAGKKIETDPIKKALRKKK